MNTGEHHTALGVMLMHGKPAGADAALTELKSRMSDALADQGLAKSQLAARTGLSRTTVSEAFRRGRLPSPATLVALARALRLPAQELLDLQRSAAAKPDADTEPEPGRSSAKPVSHWDPHDLEVHPAGPGARGGARGAKAAVLSGYVPREHDRVLEQVVNDAAQGHSRMLVLVGTSSTGKTRACWEAAQVLAAQGWLLWHPYDPTPAGAALEQLQHVKPRTVVWLNETQHYLGDVHTGERIAAALHTLLTDAAKAPVLVLGTLWPEFDRQYTAAAVSGSPDRHPRARALLAGRTLTVPDRFDDESLRTASTLAKDGDRLLADTLTRAGTHGRVTQDLAGAPQLLDRYHRVPPPARALLEAAMDARRLGVGLHLPQAFLTDAVPGYLSDDDYEALTDDWAEAAYAELARSVLGKQAPLRRVNARPAHRTPVGPEPSSPIASAGPLFRLADFLDQYGRTDRRPLCPPASFWNAAHTHLTRADDLRNLAAAADARLRLQWGHHLRCQAARRGDGSSLMRLARLRQRAGDLDGAETLYQRAIGAGEPDALVQLADLRERAGDRDGAEALAQQAVEAGIDGAFWQLAVVRAEAGDMEGADTLAQRAPAPLGDRISTVTLVRLAHLLEEAGHQGRAEALFQRAVDAGNFSALGDLVRLREAAEDQDGAEAALQRAADAGSGNALAYLASRREKTGDLDGALELAQRAAEAGVRVALVNLGWARKEAGDLEGADALYQRAAEAGDAEVLIHLASMREEAGNKEGVEALAQLALDTGNSTALAGLARMWQKAGDQGRAGVLYQQAVDAGNSTAFIPLIQLRVATGDWDIAEALTRRAISTVGVAGLARLARVWERAGNQAVAEDLYQRAVDANFGGHILRKVIIGMWPSDRAVAEALAQRAATVGDFSLLLCLEQLRDETSDTARVEALYRCVADAGAGRRSLLSRPLRPTWPHGLDADGEPSTPWERDHVPSDLLTIARD